MWELRINDDDADCHQAYSFLQISYFLIVLYENTSYHIIILVVVSNSDEMHFSSDVRITLYNKTRSFWQTYFHFVWKL